MRLEIPGESELPILPNENVILVLLSIDTETDY